jgi:hypothetical protein
MKMSIRTLVVFSAALISFQACKKSKNETGSPFSQQIQTIVPDSLIQKFRTAGIEINEGKTPPSINGIYLSNPMNTLYDNSGTAGNTISDYKYKFYEQDNQNLTIKLDYKAMNFSDFATGSGAYLSGANNKFTAFVESSGTSNGINYKVLSIYSGEMSAQGIANFKHAVYVKEKGNDPNNLLSPVGTLRIYKDGNNLAEVSSSY